jgi:hypothetical protein
MNDNITFGNGRKGLIGIYDAAQTQAIFAMGAAYVLTNGGASSNIGNLYGLAWSYNPDYGGGGNNPQSKAGLNHQLLHMQNGITTTAIGSGIWTNGSITATGDITAYYSDGRLKENLKPLKNAIFKINTLTGYTYNTNALGRKLLENENDTDIKVGLIAQDLQKVLPEAVKLAPFDGDARNNSKSGENYLTIQYEKIVPLLIEGIKEQQLQIEELKNKIQILENNLKK